MTTKKQSSVGGQISLHFQNQKNTVKGRKKSSQKTPVFYKRRLASYELNKDYKKFDFIAWPFVVLSGFFLHKEVIFPDTKPLSKKLAELFGVTYSEKNRILIENFVREEASRFKLDPSRRRTHRGFQEEDFKKVIEAGFEYCFQRRLSPQSLRIELRSTLPKKGMDLSFSTIGRLVWNGHHDSNWYEGTRETLVKSFPNYDIQLLCDLFAATSIRASLESNVTKFFKALRQYHEKQTHVSWIGINGNKRKFESIFHGFLDATLVNLNKIAQGLRPGHPSKSGRKIHNFSLAMNGKLDAIVVDIWIMRAFEIDQLRPFLGKDTSRSPDMHTYDAIEWYLRRLGNFLQREPRGVCSSIWCSIRWEEGHTSNTTRYDEFVKFRMNNGLFSEIYGELPSDSSVFPEKFFEKC